MGNYPQIDVGWSIIIITMNIKLFQKYQKRKYLLFIWGVAGTVVCFATIFAVYSLLRYHERLPQQPDIGGTVLTSHLLQTTEKLQASLNEPLSGSPAKTTETYISYMHDIENECTGFQTYVNLGQDMQQQSNTTVYLKKSTTMCHKLSSLATQSEKLYQAALPAMNIDTHIKRYQTLPLVWEMVRDAQLKAANSILSAVTQASKTMEYPTQAPQLVLQLKGALEDSHKLSYAPAVAQFQLNILAERQRYWLSYNELQNLMSALKVQLRSYCTNLSPADAGTLSACRQT